MSRIALSASLINVAAHVGASSRVRGEWAKNNDRGYSVGRSKKSRTASSIFFSTMTTCFKHRSPVPPGM